MSRSTNLRKYQCASAVYEIKPLEDPRWGAFLERHPRSSVFHASPWLEALRRTYGYEPVAYSTSRPGDDLQNALLFCRVSSWLTGRRLVSLPFSDHCEPLVDSSADLNALRIAAEQQLSQANLRYIELRPIGMAQDQTSTLSRSAYTYCFHQVDLRSDLITLFGNCHTSTRRNIRRAEREGLAYEEGRSKALLDAFFRLHVLTRRRHQAPPQPKDWFVNLIDCFGDALKIRVAYRNGRAIAAILTLRHKDTVTYKYGCSDEQFNNLGGTHFLIWKTIQEAKDDGLHLLDLGRSDISNKGLLTFKDRFGGRRSTLIYSRFAASGNSRYHFQAMHDRIGERLAKAVVSTLPDRMFCTLGRLVYRHIG
jgi:CelD/BcsL family acetyltransferase involved in cellulose biosynthesis